MDSLPEAAARSFGLQLGGERFITGSFCLTGRKSKPLAGNAGELLGFEEVYISILKHLDHGGGEVEQPQVVIDEAGE